MMAVKEYGMGAPVKCARKPARKESSHGCKNTSGKVHPRIDGSNVRRTGRPEGREEHATKGERGSACRIANNRLGEDANGLHAIRGRKGRRQESDGAPKHAIGWWLRVTSPPKHGQRFLYVRANKYTHSCLDLMRGWVRAPEFRHLTPQRMADHLLTREGFGNHVSFNPYQHTSAQLRRLQYDDPFIDLAPGYIPYGRSFDPDYEARNLAETLGVCCRTCACVFHFVQNHDGSQAANAHRFWFRASLSFRSPGLMNARVVPICRGCVTRYRGYCRSRELEAEWDERAAAGWLAKIVSCAPEWAVTCSPKEGL